MASIQAPMLTPAQELPLAILLMPLTLLLQQLLVIAETGSWLCPGEPSQTEEGVFQEGSKSSVGVISGTSMFEVFGLFTEVCCART